MAKALWIQSVSGTALRLSQVTHLIPRPADTKKGPAGEAGSFELAASVSGATPVVVAAGLPTREAAEAARDALIDFDDEVPGKLTYTQGHWAHEQKKAA